MSKKIIVALWLCAALLLAVALMAGSEGLASAQDTPDPIPHETCTICHPEAGAKHQEVYDELYQDEVIQVTDLAYSFTAPDTHIVTFQMTKNGAPFNAQDADSVGVYLVPYTGEAFEFEPALERLALTGEWTYDGEGGNTSTLTSSDPEYAEDFGQVDGLSAGSRLASARPSTPLRPCWKPAAALTMSLPPTTMAAKNATPTPTSSTATSTPRSMAILPLTSIPVKPATWTTGRAAISNGSSWLMIRSWLLRFLQAKLS